ncbi:glucans biosynthesis glucosyltransferase MdoH [Aestuariivirga sp.]|uniref:glucans biosynthesis glucosyltransferase MdoH n=1 Tax=Aestuariivirga sp. TaxID=2650926 RepID=UPI0025BF615B|nr:glucans biosynthesis glucosyltransferase MdoH [Aestuariivirga sp.]MCA3554552.1 glucans biosynthesis glucosyltransferase MdoH [Aestuariivirga sp.]
MAVPVDQKLTGATPAEAPLAMPVQNLRAWAGKPASAGNPRGVTLARLFVFGASLLITGLGTWKMYQVISPVNVTTLQVLFASFFALTFAWIAFSCASAILGFLVLLFGRARLPPLAETCEMGRTALLMPVYNEDPERVFAALSRIGLALRREGVARHFDIFVLSDTRKDHIAAAEADACEWLKRQLGPAVKVHYRRRGNNHHRKAGNIADFVTRWGGAYDHMIVLDADSDMSAGAMITLARAMAADPKAGIIQSLPLLQNRWTPFARMTQFAGRVYGPLVAAGLSAWHGRDGNYWGHNAIIRTKAFAGACGLPELQGRKPFGGHVLSHDFVEAALIRRAGWAVYMLPGLAGSYEETPPCLIDLATRDRRWAQGNLQHMKIAGASGLHWVSRVHLVQGIMSYLASPLWLMLLLAGLLLATVARHTTPNYFPDSFSLFPDWPVFDPELALRLFAITFVVLYLPKLLALILALKDSELRKGCGGAIGLLKSVLAETFVSMLLSPIMMLIQSRVVADVMIGRDSGWNAQNRDDQAMPFKACARVHALHVLAGIAFGVLAFHISWATFLWLSPIAGALMLAPLVSWATGIPELGRKLWHWNVFRIPEEAPRKAEEVVAEAELVEPLLEAAQ